jgi:hypothetical protein
MTTDKAREFFSGYFEGSLEEGLKLSLEQAFRRDPGLKEEYDLFADTVRELDHLGETEIPVPFDLHERIVARIEDGTKKKALPPLVLWRNLAFGAVAAALIAGAFISLKGRMDGSTNLPAGVLPGPSSSTQNAIVKPAVRYDGYNVTVTVQTDAEGKLLKVESAPDGKSLRMVNLVANQTVEAPLSNPQTDTKAFRVVVMGQSNDLIVAIPGSTPDGRQLGEGSGVDFAVALAGHYHNPVVLQGSLASDKLKWDFTGQSVSDAVNAAFQNSAPLQVMDSGLVRIGD